MKKIVCIFLTTILLIGAIMVPVSATENTEPEAVEYTAPIYYGAQSAAGTTENTRKIRFVSLVPNGNGSALGYEIVVKYTEGGKTKVVRYGVAQGDETMESNTVYSSLLAAYGTEAIDTQAVVNDMKTKGTYNGDTAFGLFVVVIDNIPVDAQFDVRTYVKDSDTTPEDKSGCTGVTLTTAGAIGTVTPAVAWATQGGDGSAAYPYVLNQRNFVAFYNANKTTDNSATISASAVHFELESDVVVNESLNTSESIKWSAPLKSLTAGSSFNGNGNTISGIYMQTTANVYCGLFTAINDGAVVKNLNVTDSYFEANYTGGATYAGAVAGRLKGATIENCYSNATVMHRYGGQEHCAGGIVGCVYNDNGVKATIAKCVFEGQVSIVQGKAGGIAGYIIFQRQNITINNCLNLGSVKSTAGFAGGILGVVDHNTKNIEIKNCVNLSTDISAPGTGNKIKGDIFSAMHDTQIEPVKIEGCYSVIGYSVGSTHIGVTTLDSIDTLKTTLKAIGWYCEDGCLPSPIEGKPFLISLQYNYYIGKGYDLDTEYEFVEGFSTKETVVVDGIKFLWAQGGCISDKYYYCFMTTDKRYSPQKAVILKYDLVTQQLVAQSEVLTLGHSNDAAYNPYNNTIVLINGGEGHIVLDAHSLTRKEVEFPAKYSSGMVSYDPDNHLYMIGTNYSICFYDDDFELAKEFSYFGLFEEFDKETGKYGTQGMTSDGKYLYILENWINNDDTTDQKCNIVVYDINTMELIDRIPLHMGREVEHIFIWNNSFYITCNNLDWDGAECYKVDIVVKD